MARIAPCMTSSGPRLGSCAWVWLWLLVLTIGTVGDARSLEQPAPALPSPDDVYDDGQALMDSHFQESLARFDEALDRDPEDFDLRIKRCEYIAAFLNFEDFYVESAEEALEQCHQRLDDRFPGHPEVALLRLDWQYGEEALDFAQQLIDDGLEHWNASQQARLYLTVSHNLDYAADETDRAGTYCVMALALDVATDCRLTAARFHNSLGRDAQAIEVLASSLDPIDEPYHLAQKAMLLLDYGAVDKASDIYNRIAESEKPLYEVVPLAQRLAAAGLVDQALDALDRAQVTDWNRSKVARTKFSIAMLGDDPELALTRYNELRDLGRTVDPLLRSRLALAIKDPTLEWRGRDAEGLAGLVLTILVMALLTLVVPAIVHYRGLARWTNGLSPGTETSLWTLRHAWMALFALVLAGFVALYVADYQVLLNLIGNGDGVWERSNAAAARAKILESALLAVGLLPLLLTAGRWRALGPGQWSVIRCVFVAIGLAVLFRVLFGVLAVLLSDEIDLGVGQVLTTTRIFLAMGAEYGMFATLLFAAVLIPVVEEVVFRGILLQGFSRHLSAGGANLLQSVMFAAVHEAFLFFPLYVALAYVLGAVARRSGGLLTPILIHSAFNAGAVAATLWIEARILAG